MRVKYSLLKKTALLLLLGSVVTVMLSLNPGQPGTAAAAIAQPPQLNSPADGATLSNFGPTLRWSNPSGATQYQLQVTPANNDGPGVNLIGNAVTSFDIPAPPNWYGLLPGMSYTWKVRATDATVAVGESDSGWGPWSDEWTFRTPKTTSASITLVSPVNGSQVTGPNPVLAWSNIDPSIFYYEIQASKDQTFNTDPGTATAMVYWQLLHGGVTVPINSYTIPQEFPLEAGTTYYWRVRPRVQGDGTPLEWTAPASLKTPAADALFLQVTAPADESTATTSTVTVTGRTRPGAFVTVNETLATVDTAGNFSASVTLEEGPNSIYVIASDASGAVLTAVLTVTYIP